ncbi:putative reverse transcriptase domain-containing protein [Tanacetum coccineum]
MVAVTEPSTIQKVVQIAGTLTDEALRNRPIKKNPEKRGNGGEPSKDINERDDNKRTRTENAFATTANPVRREYTGNFAKDCRVVPRNVNPINARNPVARTVTSVARGRGCMLGAEEARQDLNIVRSTFTLNDHYATTFFDSGADYSFVSTTFIPMLDIKPSDLGFSYEIEIASRQLVEIDKVIKGCKLEIEGHVFDIILIPFRSGSFDMIIGMDWLSNHRAEIICHKKVVRIPLLGGKVLRVIGERPEEKARQLMSAKAKEKKQEEIIVVRVFPEVFLDDLSGLPPNREIEFRIELIPEAMPVAKSPYRLAPSELEELSGQLKELQDKGFIRPSSSPWGAPTLVRLKLFGNWKAPRTPSEVCSFLGLAGSYEWVREENAFQTLKDKLCNAPVLALPDGPEDFMVYCDASRLGLGTVFREPPYRFNYPTRRLTVEEMLAKFIIEGKRELEEMEIFIKEFRTTNELLLKTRSNLLSELTIEYTAEDDLEVFSTKDPGLDWIFAHNFLTCLQKLSSYAFGHLEVFELAACLENVHFLTLLVMSKFSKTATHYSSYCSCRSLLESSSTPLVLLNLSLPPKQTPPVLLADNELTTIVFIKDLSFTHYRILLCGRDEYPSTYGSLAKHS